jgi:hypothetical protein
MAEITEKGRPLDKETAVLIDKFESAIGESVKIEVVMKAAMTLIINSLLIFYEKTNPVFTIKRMDGIIANIKSNVLRNMVIMDRHESNAN